VPIIANGNVIDWKDVVDNRAETGADGIMSAEGLLNDPTLFSQALPLPLQLQLQLRHSGTSSSGSSSGSSSSTPSVVGVVDKLSIALEYLELCETYPVPIKSVIFHTRRMCSEFLDKYQLMVDLLESVTLAMVKGVVLMAVGIREACVREGRDFKPDPTVGSCSYYYYYYF
jgi:tRNA-dihydrouridine synthase 1